MRTARRQWIPFIVLLFSVCVSQAVPIIRVLSTDVSISATVPSQPANLPVSISNENKSEVRQLDTIYYTVTYGSNLAYATPLTITASWTRGNIQNSSSLVDIVGYESGSATNAYGATPPVIDNEKRTITWTIPSFPANTTDRIVSFNLKTTDAYTDPTNGVDFSVSAQVTDGNTINSATLSQSYHYDSTIIQPTATPGPTKAVTPTPTPYVPQLQFNTVSLTNLSNTTATIQSTTNLSSRIKVLYGTSIGKLTNQIQNTSDTTFQQIQLTDLTPESVYYFKIIALSGSHTRDSDIYTFTTAKNPPTVTLEKNTLIVVSNDQILLDPLSTSLGNTIVLPPNMPFQIKFKLANPPAIKEIQLILQNAQVLGSETTSPSSNGSPSYVLEEISPGVYLAKLTTKQTPGLYNVILRITESTGPITEQTLLKIRTTEPLTVHDTSGKPIEAARVHISQYSQTKKQFLPLTTGGNVKNPLYTDASGQVFFVLPEGRYYADVRAIGYKTKQVTFDIGPGDTQVYPQVTLQKEGLSMLNMAMYYGSTIRDSSQTITQTFITLSYSSRFGNLIFSLIILMLLVTLFLTFGLRTHISLRHMPHYIMYLLSRITNRHVKRYIIGSVLDTETKQPINNVLLYFLDSNTKQVLGETKNLRNGSFFYANPGATACEVMAVKDGFSPTTVDYLTVTSEKAITLLLEKTHGATHPVRRSIWAACETILSFSFEFLLILTFIFAILFIRQKGVESVLPFLVFWFLTVLLWLGYHRHHKALI